MMGMVSGVILTWILLATFVVIGFAYIIWVLASKETAGTKLLGQIIAAVVAILAVILLVYGGLSWQKMAKNCTCGQGSSMMGCGMMGGPQMMGKGMMGKPNMMGPCSTGVKAVSPKAKIKTR